jgi:pimeloyl-ACP methyl ester carboxylesterase
MIRMRRLHRSAVKVAFIGMMLAAFGSIYLGKPAQADGLTWRSCDDGFQCAKLTVPRDWTKPGNGSIQLSLIRLPATNGRRIGSLLVNYGGPGASGVMELRGSGKLIQQHTEGRFDVVSWDPRGVGESAPIVCPEGNEAFYNADPETAAGILAIASSVRVRAKACGERYGSYLAAIGTVQVVQDMDAIRQALGEAKVTYLGLSYGTRVGAVYAQRYPQRVRAMVLDGSLPPVSTLEEITTTMATSFERGLHDWIRRCAARPPCAFGPKPFQAFDDLYARVRRNPPVVPSMGGRRLTVGLLNQIMLAGIVNFNGSTELAEAAIRAYTETGMYAPLLTLGEGITSRQPDGSYARNGTETFQFINCLDWQDRPPLTQVTALTAQVQRAAPRLGAFAIAFVYANALGCPQPATPVPPVTQTNLPPLLVVGNNGDPETPLAWSQELSQALPQSRLLVSQSFGHTAFVTSPCVARLSGRYLVDLILPQVGTVCPDPDPMPALPARARML